MRQTLRVTAVEGARVRLAADRAASCGACAARAGCAASSLAEMLGQGPQELTLPAPQGLRPGDEVTVTLPAGGFLHAVGLAYLLPPAALVLGVGLMAALGLPDWLCALLSLPLLALSFWPLARAERRGQIARALEIEEIHPAEAP